jgi:hypothetical protein
VYPLSLKLDHLARTLDWFGVQNTVCDWKYPAAAGLYSQREALAPSPSE